MTTSSDKSHAGQHVLLRNDSYAVAENGKKSLLLFPISQVYVLDSSAR